MDDKLSSGSAEEYGDESNREGSWSPRDYETLEEYIMSTERDHDKEAKKSMRLFDWQDTLCRMIDLELETNKTEIILRAYPMGVSILSQNHDGEIDEIANLLKEFMFLYTRDVSNMEEVDKTDSRLNSGSIEQPYGEDDSLSDPFSYKIRSSYLQQAERNYTDHAFMKGWIHRHIVALGLGQSTNTMESHEAKISSYEAAFSKAIDDFRQSIEDEVMSYVQRSEMVWRDVGLKMEIYEGLTDILNHMETENKKDLEYKLNQIEDFVIDEDDGNE